MLVYHFMAPAFLVNIPFLFNKLIYILLTDLRLGSRFHSAQVVLDSAQEAPSLETAVDAIYEREIAFCCTCKRAHSNLIDASFETSVVMSIIYSLIARGTTVLVDYTESTGNFQQITSSILQKIPLDDDTKCTYVSGR